MRFIGNITDFAVMDKGDIVIDGCKNGVTFEGIGSDATANGWGLRIKGSSNVEIRNLGFMNCDSNEGDNIGLQQDNDHVWVHNCDLFYGDAGSDAGQAKGDGALETKLSDHVTQSYNHFWDSGKSNLLGNDPSDEAGNRITYHHNWYDHSDSRHPRIRAATVHIYNNYFDGPAKYGAGVTSAASAFVEANYFRSTSAMRPMMSSLQGTDAKGEGTFSGEEGGIIKSFGNVYDGDDVRLITYEQNAESFDCYEASSRTERVPSSVVTLVGGNTYNNFDTAADFYAYSADSPGEAVQKVLKYAGRVGGGDFSWEFDDGEDGNYDVIPELKAALEGYTGSPVKVGGDSAQPGGGDDPGEGGQTGGEDTPGGGGQPVEGAIVAWFADDACTDPAISVSGNTSTSKGSVTYGGITYSSCLKMESSTLVSFDIASDMKLTLVLNDAAGKNIKIDGEKHAVGADGTLAITLAAGEHTITKGDTMNLFVLVLEPV